VRNVYESNSDWSEAQPSAEEENRSVDENGWEAFAKWHLAYDTEASEETKSRYKLPFGDFRKLHRSASSLPNNAPVPKTTTMSKAPPTDRSRNTLAKTTSGIFGKGGNLRGDLPRSRNAK
jgi:hypothetical protein